MANKIHEIWASIGETNSSPNKATITPLWSIDLKDDAKVAEWMKNTIEILTRDNEQNLNRWAENIRFYKGDHTEQDRRRTRGEEVNVTGNSKKIVTREITANMCFEFVQILVNRLSQIQPKIEVTPSKGEFQDKIKAEMAKDAIDYIFDKNSMPFTIQALQEASKILGEAYLYPHWDPTKGGIKPNFKEEEIKSKVIKINSGEDISVEVAPTVGDVAFKVLLPWLVLLPQETSYTDCDYAIIVEFKDREELQVLYPNIDFSGMASGSYLGHPNNKLECYTLFHRAHPYLARGRMITFCGDKVLSNLPHPYKHRKLPLIPLTDIDIPGQIRARSMVENIKPLNIAYNKIKTGAYRNIAMASQLKWIVPAGSTQVTSLGNSQTVVEYHGAVPPRIETPRVISGEIFQYEGGIRKEAESVSMIQSFSLGTPPANVRSGIQMAQLAEQQERALNFHTIKRFAVIEEAAKQGLSIASDYYKKDDNRMLKLVGRDKEPVLKLLDPSFLDGEFNIKIQNSSAMPEGKFAKMEILTTLRQTFGEGLIPNEVAAEAFEIGRPEDIIKFIAASVDRAKLDIETLKSGKMPLPPEKYEDLIVKWQVYVGAMRSASFSTYPQNIKDNFSRYLRGVEMLMEEKANDNPLFFQQLATLASFPAVYTTKILVPPPAPTEPLPAEPAEGTIPAPAPSPIMDEELPPEEMAQV